MKYGNVQLKIGCEKLCPAVGCALSKFLRLFIYCFLCNTFFPFLFEGCGFFWSASSISMFIGNDGVTHQTHHNGNAFHLHASDVTVPRQYRSKQQRMEWNGFVRCTRIFPRRIERRRDRAIKKNLSEMKSGVTRCE